MLPCGLCLALLWCQMQIVYTVRYAYCLHCGFILIFIFWGIICRCLASYKTVIFYIVYYYAAVYTVYLRTCILRGVCGSQCPIYYLCVGREGGREGYVCMYMRAYLVLMTRSTTLWFPSGTQQTQVNPPQTDNQVRTLLQIRTLCSRRKSLLLS